MNAFMVSNLSVGCCSSAIQDQEGQICVKRSLDATETQTQTGDAKPEAKHTPPVKNPKWRNVTGSQWYRESGGVSREENHGNHPMMAQAGLERTASRKALWQSIYGHEKLVKEHDAEDEGHGSDLEVKRLHSGDRSWS